MEADGYKYSNCTSPGASLGRMIMAAPSRQMTWWYQDLILQAGVRFNDSQCIATFILECGTFATECYGQDPEKRVSCLSVAFDIHFLS
jgi:hypothetical protein